VKLRALVRKLVPLALSDVAMALGDPLLAITLTRLERPELSLAALGMVKAVANFLESPIIMMLHASTVLSAQAASRAALWRFMLLASGGLTLLFGGLAIPCVYGWLVDSVFAVGPAVGKAGRGAFLMMVFWPAVIAWRRFYQGQLIRQGRGGYLGWASMGRLAAFTAVLAVGYQLDHPNGALLAASALMAGIVVEALAATLWARQGQVKEAEEGAVLPATLAGVWSFYAPLAGTMLGVWGGRALLIALIARSEDARLALAAWAAIWGFVVLVANATRMVQQLVITHSRETTAVVLFQLAVGAGLAGSALLAMLAYTEQGHSLVGHLLGGERSAVTAAALPVLMWSWPLPLLVALQNALQGFCLASHRSSRVSAASLAGTGLTLAVTGSLIAGLWPGAAAAGVGILAGILAEVLLLANLRPWSGLYGAAQVI